MSHLSPPPLKPEHLDWALEQARVEFAGSLTAVEQAHTELLNGTAAQRLQFALPFVNPEEFVVGKEWMNAKDRMYPEVFENFIELNKIEWQNGVPYGKYCESILTGSIGSGKTTLALFTQAYQLYLLLALANPHFIFDLSPESEIEIVFQSVNARVAKETEFLRFRSLLESAPMFRNPELQFDPNLKSKLVFRNNIIVTPITGIATGAIGQNVIGGIIDEINYMRIVEKSKANPDGGSYDQAVENYSAIARRRESRFIKQGWIPGMLCLVSSARYPGQFTDRKRKEAQKPGSKVFLYDKRIWEIKPWDFSGKIFYLFFGDVTRKPKILEDNEEIDISDRDLVMPIPVEFKPQFENDLLGSIRDIAGVSTLAIHPYMFDVNRLAACFTKSKSIFSQEEIDFVSRELSIYPNRIEKPDQPRFVHLDLAVSSDSVGLSIGWVPRFVEVPQGDHIEILPEIRFDGILRVLPPRGGEILFSRIRQIIYTLRDKLKMNIRWVTCDSFQSVDTIQILRGRGFITGIISVDKDERPYSIAKGAIYDGRILAPPHVHALHEWSRLEKDEKTGKIDHPPNGSKDVSDSMAAVVFGLTMRREIWVMHGLNPSDIPARLISDIQKSERKLEDVNPTGIFKEATMTVRI